MRRNKVFMLIASAKNLQKSEVYLPALFLVMYGNLGVHVYPYPELTSSQNLETN